MDPPKFAQSPPKLSFWGCFPGLRGVHFGEAEQDLAQRIRHCLARLKPIVSLFAANAQLCTHDVALCRLLSLPSCVLYNLVCAHLRITAYYALYGGFDQG
jgi:hypothetical protein